MAKKYTIEGVVFNETGDPLTDSYNYNFYIGQYQMTLGTQTPGSPQYNKTKKIIEGITNRIKELNKVVKTDADKVKNDKIIKEAKEKLKKAEANAQYAADSQNVKAYEEAVKAANAAREAITNAGGTPPPLPNIKPPSGTTAAVENTPAATSDVVVTPEEVANNKFKDYTVNSNGAVTNKKGIATYFVSVKNPDGSSTMQEYESVVQARDAFLKGYSKPNELDALKQKLRAGNWITSKQLANNEWLIGLDAMIAKYTYDAVSAVKYGGAKEAPLIDAWFASARSGAGTGTESKAGTWKDTGLDLTTVGDAYNQINDYMIDALGREATQEEKDAYYKDINARELKSSVETVEVRDATGKITKSKRTGDFVTDDERINAMNTIVIKALSGTDAGALLKSAKGSQVAVQIAALQKAGAEYGQPLSAGEALKYVIEGGTQKDAVAKQTERMRLNAMTMYSNLKDHIRDGGNVKDIADQYAVLKAKKLGIPVTDAFNDKDVLGAITKDGGLMSTTEFSRQMQANPLWRQTDEARDVASNFANTILKSFGFMG